MKKVVFAMATVLLTSAISQAMIAPWYENLRRIDAAVEEVADKLNYDDVDEVGISMIEVGEDGIITVGIENKLCLAQVSTKPMKSGLAGASVLVAKVLECGPVNAEVATATYEKVSAKMDAAAKLAKMVKKVTVSKGGKIKIVNKK